MDIGNEVIAARQQYIVVDHGHTFAISPWETWWTLGIFSKVLCPVLNLSCWFPAVPGSFLTILRACEKTCLPRFCFQILLPLELQNRGTHLRNRKYYRLCYLHLFTDWDAHPLAKGAFWMHLEDAESQQVAQPIQETLLVILFLIPSSLQFL